MPIMRLLTVGTLAVQFILALPIMYLCAVAIAALAATRRHHCELANERAIVRPPYQRFVVLVPAHDEETMISALLSNLQALAYPRDRYTVYVVADNCSDRTAGLARTCAGVEVLERHDPTHRGRGFALKWAFEELHARGVTFDACVILDADSVVGPHFLMAFADALAEGAKAAQACNTVLNPLEAPSATLRWLALTLMNHVRPLGRNQLGASSTLTGNGMCLTSELLDRYPWRALGVMEDYEYCLALILGGERVRYVPGAVVRSHMPTSFAQLQTQDIRWESSVPEMTIWNIGRRLLWRGLQERDLVRLEAVAELATPPLSSLVAASVTSLAVALLVRSPFESIIGALLLAALGAYGASALWVLRPPRRAYPLLAYAPLYIVRKLWVRAVLRRRRATAGIWVRTARPSGSQ
jgi:cellulose synthase/poly-beta-1,6-N-acetylglucosamine synthase-like glycosyltransferase